MKQGQFPKIGLVLLNTTITIILAALFIRMYSYAHDLELCSEANQSFVEQNNYLIQNVSDLLQTVSLSENDIYIFEFSNNETYPIDVYITRKTLVLKYPIKACDCFDNILLLLSDNKKELGSDFKVAVPKGKYRYYKTLLLDHNLSPQKLIAFSDSTSINHLDEGIIPFFFILDTNLEANTFFRPILNHDEVLLEYLQYTGSAISN
jgi:hypothetical protein